jgi:thiamine-monophosphate kinase
MNEFEIIRRYFESKDLPVSVKLGVGDDGAIIHNDPGKNLVIATDTLVSGIHFPANSSPCDIGYRSVVVNVSDIAAMGGKPEWMTLALSLSETNSEWLRDFSKGLFLAADEYSLNLIGGDLTKADQDIITIQMIGEVDTDTQLLRSNAQPGELLFVTGTLGDAAAGLEQFEKKAVLNQYNQYLIERFFRPSARVDIGLAIMDYASSSIDISDGLIGDLKKIMSASDVGAILHIEDIPLSKEMLKTYEPKISQTFALSGGDDYELLFTTPSENLSKIMDISKEIDQKITHIGNITENKNLECRKEGVIYEYQDEGYLHFK